MIWPVLTFTGDTLNEVEVSVTPRVVPWIEPVESEDFNQLSPSHSIAFLQLRVINARPVVFVDDPQLKTFAFELTYAEVINVFHHQVPGRNDGFVNVANGYFAWAKKFQGGEITSSSFRFP